MKNLFLTLAFVFATSFSFANTSSSQTSSEAIVKCIHVTLSCGVKYDICNFKGTAKQLIKAVLVNDDAICPS